MENLAPLMIPLETIVTLTFYFFIVVYAIFSTIFFYHWQSYSTNKAATTATYIAYFGISLPLLGLMGMATLTL